MSIITFLKNRCYKALDKKIKKLKTKVDYYYQNAQVSMQIFFELEQFISNMQDRAHNADPEAILYLSCFYYESLNEIKSYKQDYFSNLEQCEDTLKVIISLLKKQQDYATKNKTNLENQLNDLQTFKASIEKELNTSQR